MLLALGFTLAVALALLGPQHASAQPHSDENQPEATATPIDISGVHVVTTATLSNSVYLPIAVVDSSGAITPTDEVTETGTITSTDDLTDTSGYSPTVLAPVSATVFGIESLGYTAPGNLEKVGATSASWTRINALDWSSVEPNAGDRRWNATGLDDALRRASDLNLKVVLIIRGTPTWAQKTPGSVCGPVKAEQMPAYAKFVADAVTRYSAPPFNVKYWEIGNEPDAPTNTSQTVWGCWGDPKDYYYGAAYYTSALKLVYPKIKAVDAQAQVLIGGLLMNCDPVKPPAGQNCNSSRFFEGILKNGGGSSFDGVSFHTYEYYGNTPGKWGNANWNSAYNSPGPVLIAKTRFLKKQLAAYKITGKFLLNTEVGLICSGCTPAMQHNLGKAWYIPEMYAAARSEDVQAAIWFCLEGWLGTELVDGRLNALPAYDALRVAQTKLGTAQYIGRITPSDVGGVYGITGYKFKQGNRTVWLVRSTDSLKRTLKLVAMPTAAFDPMGKAIAPSRNPVMTLQPIYIEWAT